MSTVDERKLIEALEEAIADLKGKLEGVSDSVATTRPHPERWSILENVEHMVIVDGRFRERISGTPAGKDEIGNPGREAGLLESVAGRQTRFQAPEIVCPKGEFADLPEALAALETGVTKDVAMVGQRSRELRFIPVQHPVMGTLSGFEGVLLCAGHIRRHANQIQEVKEQLSRRATP